MGTNPWNILDSKTLPAKSCAGHRRPAAQALPSQAVHRNLATGPYKISMNIADGDWAIAKLSTPKERITCWSKERGEVNENNLLGGQFLMFLLKNPGK